MVDSTPSSGAWRMRHQEILNADWAAAAAALAAHIAAEASFAASDAVAAAEASIAEPELPLFAANVTPAFLRERQLQGRRYNAQQRRQRDLYWQQVHTVEGSHLQDRTWVADPDAQRK